MKNPKTSSSVSSLRGPKHGKNQDSYTILEQGDIFAYVVCDGHGDKGEYVSNAVASRVAQDVLAYTLDNDSDGPYEDTIKEAATRALVDLDNWVLHNIKQSTESGCTVAGVLYDTRDRSALLFSVGDSLVLSVQSDMEMYALPLQNASNAPQSVVTAASRKAKETGKPHMSKATGYMLFPDDPDSGLQLYSTIGDFDLKMVNPIVGVHPNIHKISYVPHGTKFLVTSDGYTDGFKPSLLSKPWYDAVYNEISRAHGRAGILTSLARQRGSQDDVTVIIFETN